MMEINNWRLVSDLVVFLVPNKNEIYFASPEKKIYIANVQKKINSKETPIELKLEENRFYLKIDDYLNLYVKSDILPDESNYYKVMNVCFDDYLSVIGNILTQVESDKGTFKDEFEVVFSENAPGEMSFISPSMSQYKSCYLEMRRRLNCEINKKTRNWKIGHRYDTLKSTIYYLGEVKSRKDNLSSTEYIKDEDKMKTAYLYIEEIDNSKDKKISDILKSRVFGKEIKVTFTQESMVDCGEVLENDVTDFQDYWEDLINNTVNYEKTKIVDGVCYYSESKYVFSILNYQTGLDPIKISQNIKNEMEDVISSLMLNNLLTFWKYNTSYVKLNENQSLEDNIDNLIKLTLGRINDENVLREVFYDSMFKSIGIDLVNLARTVILNWDEKDIYNDFDKYMKFIDYTLSHYSSKVPPIIVREKSKVYSKDNGISVTDSLGNSELANIVIEMFEKAKEKYGLGLEEFNYYNVGTKKNPNIYIDAKLTLKNIIDYVGGVDKMSESLKNEIMKRKFIFVNIQIDKDKKLELN